jgi:hypothetical protein
MNERKSMTPSKFERKGDPVRKCISLLLILVCSTAIAEVPPPEDSVNEMRVNAIYLSPQAEQPWTQGVGGELQWAHWVNPNFAWAAALGLQNWKASYEGDDTYVDPASGYPIPMHHKASGYGLNIPMGGSVLGRLPLGPFSLTGELGLRFVPVVSEVEYAVTMPNPVNPMEQVTLEQDVKIRPPIIAVAGLDLEYPLNDMVALYIGGGYQYDLLQPKIEIDLMGSTRTESNQMKAWFGRVGCTYRF